MPLLPNSHTFMLQPSELFWNLMDQRPLEWVQVCRKLKFCQHWISLEWLEKCLKVLPLLVVKLLLFSHDLLISYSLLMLLCSRVGFTSWLLFRIVNCWIPILVFLKSPPLCYTKLFVFFRDCSCISFVYLSWSRLRLFRDSDSITCSYLVISCIIKRCANLAMLTEVVAKGCEKTVFRYSSTVPNQTAKPFSPGHCHVHSLLVG